MIVGLLNMCSVPIKVPLLLLDAQQFCQYRNDISNRMIDRHYASTGDQEQGWYAVQRKELGMVEMRALRCRLYECIFLRLIM